GALLSRRHVSDRHSLDRAESHHARRAAAARRRQPAAGRRGVPLDDGAHVGPARVLLLPRPPLRHDPHVVHALVAGLDAPRACRLHPPRAGRHSTARGRRGRLAVTMFSYVLVTPARNEASTIAGTIASVVAQTVRPLKWA